MLLRTFFLLLLILFGIPFLLCFAAKRLALWFVQRCRALDRAINQLFDFGGGL